MNRHTDRVKIFTDFGTLLRLARDESRARENGDAKLYEEAKARHEAYRQVCLKSDGMMLNCTFGDLERE